MCAGGFTNGERLPAARPGPGPAQARPAGLGVDSRLRASRSWPSATRSRRAVSDCFRGHWSGELVVSGCQLLFRRRQGASRRTRSLIASAGLGLGRATGGSCEPHHGRTVARAAFRRTEVPGCEHRRRAQGKPAVVGGRGRRAAAPSGRRREPYQPGDVRWARHGVVAGQRTSAPVFVPRRLCR